MALADGDSITVGQENGGSSPPTPYTNYIGTYLTGPGWTVKNIGIGGETLATMLANAPTNVDPFIIPGTGTNVVVIWGGTNDFSENGASVSSVYANLTSYIAARHAVGWKVVVPTMISRDNLDSQKNAYNALIKANTAGADGIADFTGTTLGCDGCYSNTMWFQDGTHPTLLGITTIEAPIIGAAVNAIPHVTN